MKIKSDLAQPSFAEGAAEDHELTEAEIESFTRERVLAGEEASDPGLLKSSRYPIERLVVGTATWSCWLRSRGGT